MTEDPKPIGVDLFCGAGGMSLGFEQAGFDVVAAVDSEPIHVATHNKNFPHCRTVPASIRQLSGSRLRKMTGLGSREIDVVFGGPPCGGFSSIGRRQFSDPRNTLLRHFARLVTGLRPRYFVLENVPGLLADPMREHVEAFKRHLGKHGYSVVEPIEHLDASHFSVPQRRRRVFILGYRNYLPAPRYPVSQFADDDDGTPHSPTVWDAIGDLPNADELEQLREGDAFDGQLLPAQSDYARILRGELEDPGDLSLPRDLNGNGLTGYRRTEHSTTVAKRFAATVPGTRDRISKFPRLKLDGLSPTLRAGTGPSRGSHMAVRPIHPIYARCITIREGARLHSYPDWFQFHSTKWYGFMQIGNSVPPLLARAVARSIMEALNSSFEMDGRLQVVSTD